MLELEKLQKSYRKNEVLQDVSITVKDGESVCFVGANGAGKSTLLKIIVEAGCRNYFVEWKSGGWNVSFGACRLCATGKSVI